MGDVQVDGGLHGNVGWWGDWGYNTARGVEADNYIMGT